jgi:DNA (cytosine-5)-methyltransferase 1
VSAKGAKLRVDADRSGKKFLEMLLILRQSNALESPTLRLSVVGYGGDPSTVQTVWNAVDDWVRRSSDFYSLFELYGHFTEPHPLFRIAKFLPISDHPIALFAEHASNFANCSKYFPKTHLIRLFSPVLKTENFTDIANYLRRYRFDIRSQETNIAIDADAYMVAYPFNLPSRRQMNFRLHDRALTTKPIQVEAAA